MNKSIMRQEPSRTKATSKGNYRSLVRACDSVCGMFCLCDSLELQLKLGLFPLSIGETYSVWRISCYFLYVVFIVMFIRKLSCFFFFFVLCIYRVMYAFHICPNTFNYHVAAG